MKKTFIAAVALLSTTAIFAQKKNVQSAASYLKKGQLSKSFEFIELAKVNETTANDPKMWMYRGELMLAIMQSQNIDYRTLVDDAAEEMESSFKQMRKYDDGTKYLSEIVGKYGPVRMQLFEKGVEDYNKQKYLPSLTYFGYVNLLGTVMGLVDTSAYYNTALCAQKILDADSSKTEVKEMAAKVAIESFEECAKLGYGGAGVYLELGRLLNKQGKTEEAIKKYEEGITKYPSESALVIDLVILHLNNKTLDQAKKYMELAVSNNAGSKELLFNLGYVNENLKDYFGAEEAYKKAMEIDANYFDPVYNFGAMKFNEGVELNSQANKLNFRTEQKKIDELNKLADGMFNGALPLLEKAHSINAQDKDTLSSLVQLYGRLNKQDKYKEAKAKLDVLKK
jgi:tetratricopeptide (TPR) repeat protein